MESSGSDVDVQTLSAGQYVRANGGEEVAELTESDVEDRVPENISSEEGV